MDRAVVLFNRDLRVRDNPALAAAAESAHVVVPLFVLDDAIDAPPNRRAVLADAVADLGEQLRALGAPLVVRAGDVVQRTLELEPDAVFASADVSAYAQARQRRLAEVVDLRLHPGTTIVEPGAVAPAGSDHYRVFSAYWRRWVEEPRRRPAAAPRRLPAHGLDPGTVPGGVRPTSAGLPRGGERAALLRLRRWLARGGAARYERERDNLAADATSRLSPALHFGCISASELERRVDSAAFVRQLCWRDFYAQRLWAEPGEDGATPAPAGDELDCWRRGETGVPLVDAGMRQLAHEGWMHNRARLVVASYLVHDLGLDWRHGAAHFFDLLVDGDLAQNRGNWRWAAEYRRLSPERQAGRFDPDGRYVRRWAPEHAPAALF